MLLNIKVSFSTLRMFLTDKSAKGVLQHSPANQKQELYRRPHDYIRENDNRKLKILREIQWMSEGIGNVSMDVVRYREQFDSIRSTLVPALFIFRIKLLPVNYPLAASRNILWFSCFSFCFKITLYME